MKSYNKHKRQYAITFNSFALPMIPKKRFSSLKTSEVNIFSQFKEAFIKMDFYFAANEFRRRFRVILIV